MQTKLRHLPLCQHALVALHSDSRTPGNVPEILSGSGNDSLHKLQVPGGGTFSAPKHGSEKQDFSSANHSNAPPLLSDPTVLQQLPPTHFSRRCSSELPSTVNTTAVTVPAKQNNAAPWADVNRNFRQTPTSPRQHGIHMSHLQPSTVTAPNPNCQPPNPYLRQSSLVSISQPANNPALSTPSNVTLATPQGPFTSTSLNMPYAHIN